MQDVVLTIRGRQTYEDLEPEVIELVTDGVLESRDGGWVIRYDESDLTGLSGVTTEFFLTEKEIILTRSGKMNSRMVFREGVPHESLYQLEFGALMLTVCATCVRFNLTEAGGSIDLTYGIEVEQSSAGVIEYHLDIQIKK